MESVLAITHQELDKKSDVKRSQDGKTGRVNQEKKSRPVATELQGKDSICRHDNEMTPMDYRETNVPIRINKTPSITE